MHENFLSATCEEKSCSAGDNAFCVIAEMFGYMNSLRSMTEGRGSFTMEFVRYDIVPRNVADEIISKRK